MRRAAIIGLVVLCFVVEAKLSFYGVRPNLSVLLAFGMGLRYGPYRGMAAGAALGFAADALAGSLIGPNLVGDATAGYAASFLMGRLFTWTPVLGVIGVFVLTAIDGYIAFILYSLFSHKPAGGPLAAYVVLIQAALNAPLGAFIRPRP